MQDLNGLGKLEGPNWDVRMVWSRISGPWKRGNRGCVYEFRRKAEVSEEDQGPHKIVDPMMMMQHSLGNAEHTICWENNFCSCAPFYSRRSIFLWTRAVRSSECVYRSTCPERLNAPSYLSLYKCRCSQFFSKYEYPTFKRGHVPLLPCTGIWTNNYFR